MNAKLTFERYELKYLLNPAQFRAVLHALEGPMHPDCYGEVTIRNIYFDTADYRLIRRSLEKPAYKEKLRLRSYRPAQGGDAIFVELKKKYRDVVYKRRLALPHDAVLSAFDRGMPLPGDCQIGREIDYFRSYYAPLRPAVLLTYTRQAYEPVDGSDLRATFDREICYRTDHIALHGSLPGRALLPAGATLMELKTSQGIPLWMTHLLTQQGIHKTSFSKYGTAYADLQTGGGLLYA